MNRSDKLLARTFVFFAIASSLALAQTYPVTQGKSYKFEKVAEGVYYASGGAGSNNVVIVNDDDVLIVDNGVTPAAARAFLADIKLLTPKPVRTVINTHFHYDHTGGNEIFGPEVQIIGHEFVRKAISDPDVFKKEPYKTAAAVRYPGEVAAAQKELAAEKDPAKRAALQKQLTVAQETVNGLKTMKAVPPNKVYDSKLVLHKGKREIDLLFLGRGHTQGDTFVYLPQEKIVCTGDEDEGTRLAYMGDALFDEWVTTLEKLKQVDFRLALPGHGVPFSDKSIITAQQDYLKDIVPKAAALRKQGVSAEDAAKKIDMTNHVKVFTEIKGPGAEVRGMRHLYDWLAEREKK
ncbi:MAG: MBL fold metallo-hydrolase [Bryobacteraceae bacterium]